VVRTILKSTVVKSSKTSFKGQVGGAEKTSEGDWYGDRATIDSEGEGGSPPGEIDAAGAKSATTPYDENAALDVVLEIDPLGREEMEPASDGGADVRGRGTREYGSDSGALGCFGLPRFLCCPSAVCQRQHRRSDDPAVLTGMSSHKPSFPRLTHRRHGLSVSHPRCAFLHGTHAVRTFDRRDRSDKL